MAKPKIVICMGSSCFARAGKATKADEINCGACGYNSCRAFAKALPAGKMPVDFLEAVACPGGCQNGPCSLA